MLFGERTQNATTKKRKVNKRKTKRQQKTRIKRIYTDDGVVEVLVKKKKKYGKVNLFSVHYLYFILYLSLV